MPLPLRLLAAAAALLAVACGDDAATDGVDAPLAAFDAAIADAAGADGTLDAPPQDPVDRLTPTGYTVSDFALGANDLVVRASLGTGRLWRCPRAGCPADPPSLAQPQFRTVGSIALAGDDVYWTEGASTVRRVKLDGTGATAVVTSTTAADLSADFAAAPDAVFIGYSAPGLAAHGVLRLAGASASPVTGFAGAVLAGDVVTGDGRIVYVRAASPPTAPRTVQAAALAGGEVATLGTIVHTGWGRAMAVADARLFWAEEGKLWGCDLDAGCAAPTLLLDGIDDAAIATGGERIYFGKAERGGGSIQSCPANLAPCAPEVHGRNARWILPRRLIVDGAAVYGIDQSYQAVWRGAL